MLGTEEDRGQALTAQQVYKIGYRSWMTPAFK